jgi:hypothetical protein
MGFSSQNQHRLHFGVGNSSKIEKATIYWPTGKKTIIDNPELDKLIVIKENSEGAQIQAAALPKQSE